MSECSRFCTNSSISSKLPPGLFYHLDRYPNSWKFFASNVTKFLEAPPAVAEVEHIAKITTEQSANPHWKHIRIGRITASMIGNIYRQPGYWQNAINSVPPVGLIKKALGFYTNNGNVCPNACEYGLMMESVAAHLYKEHLTLPINVDGVELEHAGLYMSTKEPWLAASPDYIARALPGNERWLIEVKSFVPLPNVSNFEQLLEARGDSYLPYYYDTFGKIHVKTDHKHYYQIQCQLYVTGLAFCDLVLFYNGNINVIRIPFNDELWNNCIYPELYAFYFRFILPEMYFKRIQNGKPLYTDQQG
jgi:YqaJ-like viral recombinase domain